MSSERKIVGFDRKLELSWLDTTAAQVAHGASPDELHAFLWKFLEGSVSAGSSGFNSDRGKTITVLKRIWCLVPEELADFRNRALKALSEIDPNERVVVHWSMCILAYPFFRDVAASVGRLLSLQDTLNTADVRRRIAESWGDRVITRNGSQRILRCFVNWGILADGDRRGQYVPTNRVPITTSTASELLTEAMIRTEERGAIQLETLSRHPVLFAFDPTGGLNPLRNCPRFRFEREGIDNEVIRLATDHRE